ncbi:MAG: glycosyl hydrolase family 95 catalytic domain-containing protein, partial [Spirochaetia bacterium]
MQRKLWYRKPAESWKEGLPLGNGRIGVMMCGEPAKERFALNHERLWRGLFRERDVENTAGYLPEVRELLFRGDYKGATELANKAFGGGGGKSGTLRRVDSFVPAGDLYFIPELPEKMVSGYKRELNLDTAVYSSSYKSFDKDIRFEAFTHFRDDLFFLKIFSGKGSISGTFILDRISDPDCRITYKPAESGLTMRGVFKEGIEFSVILKVFTKDGSASFKEPNTVQITGAGEAVLILDITVDTGDLADKEKQKPYQFSINDWETLKAAHASGYRKYYNTMTFTADIPPVEKPTDVRLKDYRGGEADPGLPVLYHNYGRYLFCCSSGIGTMPPNLQGLWNEELDPPWNCDYHNDINLQMAHWLAEPGNLSGFHTKLFHLYSRFLSHGQEAAGKLYGCRGLFLPIQTDPWGRATPESYGWAVWIGAAPWLAQHYWLHYEYTLDDDFLKDTAYPFFKLAALFYEDYLVKDDNGVFQIAPSQSPENRFIGSGDLPVSICVSSAMDVQLASDLLDHAIQASEILDTDSESRNRWRSIRNNLPELKIGKNGALLEWNEDFEEAEPGHRHISHLYGLYPGDLFTPDGTPELFDAAVKSLENRLNTGGGHTGWSRAWTACCFARIGDGVRAWDHLRALIADFATDSLLDLHPPRIYQFDGNLGGAAGVLEMLFQSYHGVLHFLPALPPLWKEGRVTGMKARGGYEVNFKWKSSRLAQAEIMPKRNGICRIMGLSGQKITVKTGSGNEVAVAEENGIKTFPVTGGTVY